MQSKSLVFSCREWKKVNSSENGRFGCGMIRKVQPEMKFQEGVTFIYPLRKKQLAVYHLQQEF